MLINAKLLAADTNLMDSFIIARVLAGYTDEYEILVRRYNKMLYKSARGILKKEEDIEDVMQEAYVRAFQKLHQFKNQAKFSTWLTRILINCALQHAGKSRKTKLLSIDGLEDDELLMSSEFQNDGEGAFETTAIRDNLRQAIETAINQLPPKYRVVFILREVEQTSVGDTAEVLGISEENVKVRLHRARLLLKDMLQSEVSSLELFHFHDTRCDLIALRVMAYLNSLPTATNGCFTKQRHRAI